MTTQTTHVREMAANLLLGRALQALDAAGGLVVFWDAEGRWQKDAFTLPGRPDRLEELAVGNAQLEEDAADIAAKARQLETDRSGLSELQDQAGDRAGHDHRAGARRGGAPRSMAALTVRRPSTSL